MSINDAREQISTLIHASCDPIWWRILDDTTPNHYGVEDIECYLEKNDIWVNIPQRTFEFKKGNLSFSARLGASNERDGVDMNFDKVVSGSGEFRFGTGGEIEIIDFRINEQIDLFEEQMA